MNFESESSCPGHISKVYEWLISVFLGQVHSHGDPQVEMEVRGIKEKEETAAPDTCEPNSVILIHGGELKTKLGGLENYEPPGTRTPFVPNTSTSVWEVGDLLLVLKCL